jgi:hypothetical protein
LQQHSLKSYTITILKTHPILYWLIIISIIISIWQRSFKKLIGYLAFGSAVIALIIIKDVERVTIPIYFMWLFMLLSDIWYKKSRFKYINALFISLLIILASNTLYRYLPKDRIKNFKKREALAKELKDIIKRNNMELEITTGFPASWEYLIEGIMQNHLFDEKNWVDYYDDLLLQGWFSRVPLVYKQHNISFNGVKRKYEHYHDWLISPKAGIIGSKGESKHIRVFLLRNLMKMYDKKFPKKGCYHQPIVVDESKHFIIHKVIYYCDNQRVDNELWRLKDNIKNIKTDNLEFKDNKIVIKGKDPKFFIKIDKKLPKFIAIDAIIHSKNSDIFQVFYKYDNEASYNEADSIRKGVKKGVNHIQIVLPSRYFKYTLRVDPSARGKGELIVEKFSIYPYDLNSTKF